MFDAGAGFFHFDIGNLVVTAGLVVTVLRYHDDSVKTRKTVTEERDAMIKAQTVMHEENRHKLNSLAEFHDEQREINRRSDDQVDELRNQTNELRVQTREVTMMAKGFNRRLEMLEDRRLQDRRGRDRHLEEQEPES